LNFLFTLLTVIAVIVIAIFSYLLPIHYPLTLLLDVRDFIKFTPYRSLLLLTLYDHPYLI